MMSNLIISCEVMEEVLCCVILACLPYVADAEGGGTPYYIAREYYNNGRRGTTSDIWALGLTMLYVFELIHFPGSFCIIERDNLLKLYWNIEYVRVALLKIVKHPLTESSLSEKTRNGLAASKQWLNYVDNIGDQLDERQLFQVILKKTLSPTPQLRPSAAELDRLMQSTQRLTSSGSPPVFSNIEPQVVLQQMEHNSPTSSINTPNSVVHSHSNRNPSARPEAPHNVVALAGGDTECISPGEYADLLYPRGPRGDTEPLPSEVYIGYEKNSPGRSRRSIRNTVDGKNSVDGGRCV